MSAMTSPKLANLMTVVFASLMREIDWNIFLVERRRLISSSFAWLRSTKALNWMKLSGAYVRVTLLVNTLDGSSEASDGRNDERNRWCLPTDCYVTSQLIFVNP